MLFAVMILLGLLAAYGIWRLLQKTTLSFAQRMFLSLMIGFGAAILFYWGTLYVSILAFQLRDRVGL